MAMFRSHRWNCRMALAFACCLIMPVPVSAQVEEVPLQVQSFTADDNGVEILDVTQGVDEAPDFLGDAAANDDGVEHKEARDDVTRDDVSFGDLRSVFFTLWEHRALSEARKAQGLVKAPTDEELRRALQGEELQIEFDTPESDLPAPEPEVKEPGERNVALGGIVYTGEDDWVFWLNGRRITPDALPEEVINLQVHEGFVEMQWLDEYTNQVFPIRLRPHQRFNLDKRIFLPG